MSSVCTRTHIYIYTAICPDLPALVNGGISYNPTTTPRLQGAMVTHFCTVVGYQLSSSTITRTCQSTRMWSGSSLICNRKSEISVFWETYRIIAVSCGSPPTITNGMMISSTGTTFGETATYTCSTGYQRSGSATITCQASGSWSTAPVCTGKTQHEDIVSDYFSQPSVMTSLHWPMESSSTIQPPPPDCREPRLHTSVLSLGTNCPHPLLLGPVSLTEHGVDHPSLVNVMFQYDHNITHVLLFRCRWLWSPH